MSDIVAFATHLAETAPKAAANMLADLSDEDVVAFLEAVDGADVRLALLTELPSAKAATVLARLPAEGAVELLQDIPYPFRTQVARALDPGALGKMMTRMSPSAQRQIRRDLVFAPDSVGAWMETPSTTLAEDDTVEDCLQRLRRRRRWLLEPSLVVVARPQRYVGMLATHELIGARPDWSVGRLADREVPPLMPDTSLGLVVEREEWGRYLLLPVVGPRHNLLGVLKIAKLREALLRRDTENMDATTPPVLASLLEVALFPGSGLGRAVPRPNRRD